MSKRLEMGRLLGDLRYQLSPGVHTYSQCSREGCECTARGGRVCSHCLADEIDGLIMTRGQGWQMVKDYRRCLVREQDLLRAAERIE